VCDLEKITLLNEDEGQDPLGVIAPRGVGVEKVGIKDLIVFPAI
jgi:hypothetical protein